MSIDTANIVQASPEVGAIQAQLQQATEAAAAATGPWIGKGDKIAADQAAVDAMNRLLGANLVFSCVVVIGEGDKDEAPMLAHGDTLGTGRRLFDLAVDPIDGTTFAATGRPGAIAVAALGERGSFPPWAGIHYMKKLAVGPQAAHLLANGDVDIDTTSPAESMRRVAAALRKPVGKLKVAVLDRQRNYGIIEAARSLGVEGLILLEGGDVVPALQTCETDTEPVVDMLYSSGGAPEAVLTAAGVGAREGGMQAMWDPQTDEERRMAAELEQLGTVFRLNDLIGTGQVFFSATGITTSALLRGCTQSPSGEWQPGTSLTVSRDRLAV